MRENSELKDNKSEGRKEEGVQPSVRSLVMPGDGSSPDFSSFELARVILVELRLSTS